MTIIKWALSEIVDNARKNSPYYKELYGNIVFKNLSDLPITNQENFWKAKILTIQETGGLVFKSGGSTGAPKYSYFTSAEWESFTSAFGNGMSKGILEDNDRVANLFYVGDLYASFIFIKDSIQSIPEIDKKIIQFPIAGGIDSKQILKTLNEFSINVIAGVPSAILNLLELFHSDKENYPGIKITKILFGGETLYPDQREALLNLIPEVKIASIGYASVDAGLLGFSDLSCQEGEHRTFDTENIIELIDPDTNEVITETDRLGKILVTNLTRKLMPIIRFPAGDLAMWTEAPGTPYRKFRLQGRSDEAARLGTLSVFFEDTRSMVMKILGDTKGVQFQMVLKHFNNNDELTLMISGIDLRPDQILEDKILDAFKHEKSVYIDLLSKKLIHPLKISIVELKQLEVNARTGKLKRIIDKRKG